MSEIEGLGALALSTEIGASLLELLRRNREKYSGKAATVVTLMAMEAILHKCTPLRIWESNQEMTFLSMMMHGGFHFSMRMGAINTAEGFMRCCPEIIQASAVEALTLGCWIAFARVDRAPLNTRPIGDLPHYLFFITMHSMTRIIGPVHCLPAGIVEIVWDVCEQEEVHIHAVARTLHAICPSALAERFPPSMRVSCEALGKEPAAALESIGRQSRGTEVFCADYESRILETLNNALGAYIVRGIWDAPLRAGRLAVWRGAHSSSQRGYQGGTLEISREPTQDPRRGGEAYTSSRAPSTTSGGVGWSGHTGPWQHRSSALYGRQMKMST
jgi:hypothetical protein